MHGLMLLFILSINLLYIVSDWLHARQSHCFLLVLFLLPLSFVQYK